MNTILHRPELPHAPELTTLMPALVAATLHCVRETAGSSRLLLLPSGAVNILKRLHVSKTKATAQLATAY